MSNATKWFLRLIARVLAGVRLYLEDGVCMCVQDDAVTGLGHPQGHSRSIFRPFSP